MGSRALGGGLDTHGDGRTRGWLRPENPWGLLGPGALPENDHRNPLGSPIPRYSPPGSRVTPTGLSYPSEKEGWVVRLGTFREKKGRNQRGQHGSRDLRRECAVLRSSVGGPRRGRGSTCLQSGPPLEEPPHEVCPLAQRRPLPRSPVVQGSPSLFPSSLPPSK